MNTWTGIGNLVRNPESSVTQSGIDSCKFTIAVNRPKDTNGDSVADFIPVHAYGKKAALCREYLTKGRKVGIVGKLQTYSYTAKDGTKKNGFEILLDELTFLATGDPNKPQLGDVHADDGVVHNATTIDTNTDFTDVTNVTTESELPF